MPDLEIAFFAWFKLDILGQDALPDWVENFYPPEGQFVSVKNDIQHIISRSREEHELDPSCLIAKYWLDRTDYQGVVNDAIAIIVKPVGDFSGVGIDGAVVVVAVIGIGHIG